jgi:hypothetical protein
LKKRLEQLALKLQFLNCAYIHPSESVHQRYIVTLFEAKKTPQVMRGLRSVAKSSKRYSTSQTPLGEWLN